jgi:DNA-binding MarR family transcriptional regulator
MNNRLPADEPLVMSLLGAAHAIEARLEAALDPVGLSLAKFGVLRTLAAAPDPMSLSDLAKQLACVRSNITQIVDRLEQDGHVRRRADPADRRGIRAELTAAGRRAAREGAELLAREQRTIVTAVAAQDADNLKHLLEILNK